MKLTPTLFPVEDSDEVLLHGEGLHGKFIIFCSSLCIDHIHFQVDITGTVGAGIFSYDPKTETKEWAAKECLASINKVIEMEIADERAGSTIQ